MGFNIVLENDIPKLLLSDEQKIEQILINLLNNAFKFTEKGQVDLICSYSNETLKFIVKDTGIGIKDENKNKLFQSFQQADSEINMKYGGTGLGLSISKELSNLLGGSLSFQSDYGVGTEFTLEIKVSIPEEIDVCLEENIVEKWLKEDPEIEDLILKAIPKIPDRIKSLRDLFDKSNFEEFSFELHKTKGFFGNFFMKEFFKCITRMESLMENEEYEYVHEEFLKIENLISIIPEKYLELPNLDKPEKEKLRIIVADDVEDNRDLVGLILKNMNVNIDYAENGVELLQKMKEVNYDVVLLDIQMPKMNGKTAIKNIRNDSSFDNIIVLALTAQAYDSDKELMLGLGCDGYITKPIDKKILRDQIRLISKERGCLTGV